VATCGRIKSRRETKSLAVAKGAEGFVQGKGAYRATYPATAALRFTKPGRIHPFLQRFILFVLTIAVER
jgi:hypothetical protein